MQFNGGFRVGAGIGGFVGVFVGVYVGAFVGAHSPNLSIKELNAVFGFESITSPSTANEKGDEIPSPNES